MLKTPLINFIIGTLKPKKIKRRKPGTYTASPTEEGAYLVIEVPGDVQVYQVQNGTHTYKGNMSVIPVGNIFTKKRSDGSGYWDDFIHGDGYTSVDTYTPLVPRFSVGYTIGDTTYGVRDWRPSMDVTKDSFYNRFRNEYAYPLLEMYGVDSDNESDINSSGEEWSVDAIEKNILRSFKARF